MYRILSCMVHTGVCCIRGTIFMFSGVDVEKISSVLLQMEVEDCEDLTGSLGVSIVGIRKYCAMDIKQAQCYRRRLVQLYCDRTAKSPQQVAEDMATVLEDEMEMMENRNKIVEKLRQITFGKLR